MLIWSEFEGRILMDIKIERSSSYCGFDIFIINGVDANLYDFGEKRLLPMTSENPYGDRGCGGVRFIRKDSTEKILSEYSITKQEYEEVCDILEDELYQGECKMCN
jgi:hypothetical protein